METTLVQNFLDERKLAIDLCRGAIKMLKYLPILDSVLHVPELDNCQRIVLNTRIHVGDRLSIDKPFCKNTRTCKLEMKCFKYFL